MVRRQVVRFGCWAVVALGSLVTLPAAPARALEGAPEPPGKEHTIADYAVWIPEGIGPIRGVIAVSNHEAGADIYRDRQTWGTMRGKTLGYRDLARRLSLALFLFKKFGANSYQESQQRQIHDALATLATRAGRPELRYAPLFPTGLSAGGYYAGWLAQFDPARVAGYFPIAGAPSLSNMAALRQVPALFINQGRDGFYPGSGVHTLREAAAGRRQGALWGGMITPPDVEHHNILRHDFILVWLEDVARLRLPATPPQDVAPVLTALTEDSGWLVDLKWHDTAGKAPLIVDSVRVVKATEVSGDRSGYLWLPTERTARALVDYHMADGHLPPSYASAATLPAPTTPLPDGGTTDARTPSTADSAVMADARAAGADLGTGPAATSDGGRIDAGSSGCATAGGVRGPATPLFVALLLLSARLRFRRAARGRLKPSHPRPLGSPRANAVSGR